MRTLDQPQSAASTTLVLDPSQKEYAHSLVQEYTGNELFKTPQPAKLLFTIDDSDTFDVRQVAQELDEGHLPLRSDVDLAFVKAGFPLPSHRSVSRDDSMPGEERWTITAMPAHQRELVDANLAVSGRIVTFPPGFNGGAGSPLFDLLGATLTIEEGPGKGLTARILSYTPGETPTATIDADWTPGETSQIALTPPPAPSGTGVTFAPGKDNKSGTVTFAKGFNGGSAAAVDLTGWMVEIVDGPGAGLTGRVQAYTPGEAPTATIGTNWAPGTQSAFSLLTTEDNTVAGANLTVSGRTITFPKGFNGGAGSPLFDLLGATLTIEEGPGKGLTAKILSYTPGETPTATIDTDWTPGEASHLALIPPPALSGAGLTFAPGKDNRGGTVTFARGFNGGSAATVSLAGWTVEIVEGAGAGLAATIQAYTPGDVPTATIDTNWAPGEGSRFGVAKPTTYTLKQAARPLRLEVYGQSDDPALLIQYRIAQIDEQISQQLSAIMHHPSFQRLEASWRGLNDLVMNSETGTRLKLRVMSVTRDELQTDLDNAVEFDQSALFKKIYESEYGVFGGFPYSALVADYAFGPFPRDVSLLEKLSNVAAAAHAPVIAAADPALFGLSDFADLDRPRDLAKIFEGADYIKWRSFRESEDSRYVSLVLPRTLMRLPYGPDTVPVEAFNFVERVDNNDSDDFLWGNASWALAQRMTDAFAKYGWTAAIRGYEGGGMVGGLPMYTFKTDEGDVAMRIPTEIAITDRREQELSDLGFIALCYRKGTDAAAFFGGQTANKPKVYLSPEATANARLSSQLPYILSASRFAHYLKVIMRDKIGSFMTQDNVATYLNRWIAQYVLLNDEAGQELKARYPLREARIDVTPDPARPGCYKAVAFLRPHFQLEELTVSIRLVAALPAPAA